MRGAEARGKASSMELSTKQQCKGNVSEKIEVFRITEKKESVIDRRWSTTVIKQLCTVRGQLSIGPTSKDTVKSVTATVRQQCKLGKGQLSIGNYRNLGEIL